MTNLFRSILISHAEVSLHDRFGDKIYWQARRSMRFNKDLVNIANTFRKNYLNSTNQKDKTIRPIDWRLEKVSNCIFGFIYLIQLYFRMKEKPLVVRT